MRNLLPPPFSPIAGDHAFALRLRGAFSMSTAASGFDELFPALPPTSVQTLTMNFYLPMTRENLMALNCGDASARCLKNVLSRGGGSSAVLVTGGARESMLAPPLVPPPSVVERRPLHLTAWDGRRTRTTPRASFSSGRGSSRSRCRRAPPSSRCGGSARTTSTRTWRSTHPPSGAGSSASSGPHLCAPPRRGPRRV